MDNLDPYKFYFELPLYKKVSIGSPTNDNFTQLIHFKGRIDAFNPNIKENSTFIIRPCIITSPINLLSQGGIDISELNCVRTGHKFIVLIHFDKNSLEIQKVGQFPSIADFHISKIRKYDKVISKENLKEFTKAIGLAANGVGIGSFVYLRRIFEGLIEEAHLNAKKNKDWDEEKYSKNRITEKIELLKGQLPEFLLKNKSLYSILSTGIHELSEQECLAHFETVRLGIELILDEKVDRHNKEKKIAEAEKKIASFSGEIKKNAK